LSAKKKRTHKNKYITAGGRVEHKLVEVDIFEPHPWQIPVLNCTDEIVLLTGSAGGGKSRVAAEKVHAFLLAYPGATALVVRKTRTSMFNSTIAFLRKEVFPRFITLKKIRHNQAMHRFDYENGSSLVYGGMNDDQQKEAIRSIGQHGGIDIAWMEEATQFEEADFNEIVSRMRGSTTFWRQILLSTNPEAPTHWIYRMFIVNPMTNVPGSGIRVFYSKESDNPANPGDYTSKLNRLTGIERDRLRDGLWKEAGGLIFDQWKDEESVTEAAEYIADGGPVLWWVDDGYAGELDKDTNFFRAGSHPRVFLFVQQRPDGTLAIFDESYEVKTLAPEHIDNMIGRTIARGYAKPSKVVYDRASASLGGYLKKELGEEWRIPEASITYNRVPVPDGNKEVNTFLAADENGVRRIIVHPRCKHLRSEMVSYRIKDGATKPDKDFDHGPDALRYGIWDLVYGNTIEVDISGGFELDLEQNMPDSDGILVFDDGDVSVAAIMTVQSR
jgi:phage terminase large subunit